MTNINYFQDEILDYFKEIINRYSDSDDILFKYYSNRYKWVSYHYDEIITEIKSFDMMYGKELKNTIIRILSKYYNENEIEKITNSVFNDIDNLKIIKEKIKHDNFKGEVSKKARKNDGRYTPSITIKGKRDELMEEGLLPESYEYDEWRSHRDGQRDLGDRTMLKLHKNKRLKYDYEERDKWNQKILKQEEIKKQMRNSPKNKK